MYKYLFFLVIQISSLPACFPQIPLDFPSIDKKDLTGARISSYRTFNGSSLFGYIDGGAELYLEYGFTASSVAEIDYMGGKYKTEIYKMNDPESAFGIFSVSKFRCQAIPDISEFTCQTRYQLQVCKGPYYINIINRTGTLSDSIASANIGMAITSKICGSSFDLSSYLKDIPSQTIKTKAILVKGRLGIINGSPDLEDYFKEIENYTAVIVKEDTKIILSVKFADSDSYKKFMTLRNWKDDDISNDGFKGSTGERINKLSENHLLIEIPE